MLKEVNPFCEVMNFELSSISGFKIVNDADSLEVLSEGFQLCEVDSKCFCANKNCSKNPKWKRKKARLPNAIIVRMRPFTAD